MSIQAATVGAVGCTVVDAVIGLLVPEAGTGLCQVHTLCQMDGKSDRIQSATETLYSKDK